MTVKELITELSSRPPNAEVHVTIGHYIDDEVWVDVQGPVVGTAEAFDDDYGGLYVLIEGTD